MAKRIMLGALAYKEKLDVWTFRNKENKMSATEIADEWLILNMIYKIILLISTTSIMMGCAATDKRLLGDPSISVALYVNQIFIARKICSQDIDYVDKSMADRFYDYAYRGTGAPGYIEYHPEFKLYFNEIQKKYIDSSENMSESKKEIFCNLFNTDLIAMKNIGVIKTIEKQIAIKNYFSPAPEDLKKNWLFDYFGGWFYSNCSGYFGSQ